MVTQSKTKTLVPRVLVGVGLGGAFLASLIDPLLFVFLAAIAAMAGTWELSSALKHGGWSVNRWAAAYLSLPVIGFSFVEGARGQWLSLLGAIAALSVVTLVYHFFENVGSTRELARNLSAGVFVMFYVPLSLSFAVFDDNRRKRNQHSFFSGADRRRNRHFWLSDRKIFWKNKICTRSQSQKDLGGFHCKCCRIVAGRHFQRCAADGIEP